jgi:hypothetical protein
MCLGTAFACLLFAGISCRSKQADPKPRGAGVIRVPLRPVVEETGDAGARLTPKRQGPP